jgi:hypothetical protein
MPDARTTPEWAFGLLNRILAASEPDDLIELPQHQAQLLATLGVRELGPLVEQIKQLGVAEAFGRHGLFSRRVRVVPEVARGDFAVHARRARQQRPPSSSPPSRDG